MIQQKPTVVLVHGAFAESASWTVVIEELQANAVPVVAVANPLRSLPGDAAYLRDVLATIDTSVILVGHSYGGMVITEAGHHPAVRRLVYVTSFLPDTGETLAGFGGADPLEHPPPLQVSHGDGTAGVREELVRPLFAQDFDDPTYAAAADRLTTQNAVVFGQPTTRAAWRELPSTYVVCGEDRATPPEKQRAQAARATAVVELPVAHHPFVTRPELVAEVLLDVAG